MAIMHLISMTILYHTAMPIMTYGYSHGLLAPFGHSQTHKYETLALHGDAIRSSDPTLACLSLYQPAYKSAQTSYYKISHVCLQDEF